MKIVYTIDAPGVGQKIRDARRLSGRSVESFAQQLGISRQAWYDIENEKVDVAAEQLKEIGRLLKPELFKLGVASLLLDDVREVSDEN